MMGRLARETDEGKKIAVVLDNARFHHAKALTDLYAPGRALERITPIYMPPQRPDPGSHRTRTGRRQEQYRQPPRARPGEHLRAPTRLHHQPHLRLRLRAPPNHTTPHRPCLIPAIAVLLAVNGLVPCESLLHPLREVRRYFFQAARITTPGVAQPGAQPPDLNRLAAKTLLTPGRWNDPCGTCPPSPPLLWAGRS